MNIMKTKTKHWTVTNLVCLISIQANGVLIIGFIHHTCWNLILVFTGTIVMCVEEYVSASLKFNMFKLKM